MAGMLKGQAAIIKKKNGGLSLCTNRWIYRSIYQWVDLWRCQLPVYFTRLFPQLPGQPDTSCRLPVVGRCQWLLVPECGWQAGITDTRHGAISRGQCLGHPSDHCLQSTPRRRRRTMIAQRPEVAGCVGVGV